MEMARILSGIEYDWKGPIWNSGGDATRTGMQYGGFLKNWSPKEIAMTAIQFGNGFYTPRRVVTDFKEKDLRLKYTRVAHPKYQNAVIRYHLHD